MTEEQRHILSEGSVRLPDGIGFPAPLLGSVPVRLPVFGGGDGWLLLGKPAGVLVDPLAGRGGVPALTAALRVQIGEGKPELVRLGIECVRSVYVLDEEIAGPVLLAVREDRAAAFRNAYGSGKFRLTFQLVARVDGGWQEQVCEVPIGYDERRGAPTTDRRYGKRARTDFRLVRQTGDYALIEATADFVRYGQIRLHAREVGLRIVGDRAMGGVAAPPASVVNRKRGWKGRDNPYYEAAMVWLHGLQFQDGTDGGDHQQTFVPPRGIAVFLKRWFGE